MLWNLCLVETMIFHICCLKCVIQFLPLSFSSLLIIPTLPKNENQQQKLAWCPGFGWDRVSFLLGSWTANAELEWECWKWRVNLRLFKSPRVNILDAKGRCVAQMSAPSCSYFVPSSLVRIDQETSKILILCLAWG